MKWNDTWLCRFFVLQPKSSTVYCSLLSSHGQSLLFTCLLLKISAQESRRKKKEYMDALERKVEVLTGENTDYKKKIEGLEESNASLLSQLQKLEALIARSSTVSTTGTTSHVVRHTDITDFTTVSSKKDTLK